MKPKSNIPMRKRKKSNNNIPKHSKKRKTGTMKLPQVSTQPDSGSESEDTEDILEMIDEDNLEYLKSTLNKKGLKKPGGRSSADNENLIELNYEKQQLVEVPKNVRQLPIKTKAGIVYTAEEEEEEVESHTGNFKDEQTMDDENDGDEESKLEPEQRCKLMSTVDLLYKRNEILETKKIQVGNLSAGILENPTEKLSNLKTLLDLLSKKTEVECVTIKKLVVVSLLEVFKDILPSYQVKPIDKGVKLKKETLRLERYESSLLQYYKKYLQALQQFSRTLLKKQQNSIVPFAAMRKLGELSLIAMCDLLHSHPYFNYAENIAEVIIPFLNHVQTSIRLKVSNTCRSVFEEDKKGEISLKMVRLINKTIKKHDYDVQSDLIEVLLYLKIRDVNLDKEQQNQLKRKKLKSHKGNVLQLSKSERKRKAHLEKLDKELLEVKAEENKQIKQKHYTEITKLTFGVFFRILKNSDNSHNLDVCLQGIIKYAHCVNIEFYIDLINVLGNLLLDDNLGYRERQLCIQTVFAVSSKQGEALNVDPTKFYAALYSSLLCTDASKSHDFSIVVETLMCALINSRGRITNKRAISFLKRLATLSVQLLHNGTLACLQIMKLLLQQHKAADVLLELESSAGEGRYLPELNDPEYCRAENAALFELALLNRHYHPIVVEFSKYIACGATSTESSLSNKNFRSTVIQLHTDFSMSEMSFNPVVPLPKKAVNRQKAMLKCPRFYDDRFKRTVFNYMRNYKNKSLFS